MSTSLLISRAVLHGSRCACAEHPRLSADSCNRGRPWLQLALIAVTLLGNVGMAGAQAISPVGALRARAIVPHTLPDTLARVRSAGDHVSSDDDGLVRVELGALGAIGGTFAGFMVGLGSAIGCRVEDCAPDSAILGAAVGLVVGSAFAAGLPQLGSRCAASRRIATGAVAAIAGAVLGGHAGEIPGSGAIAIGIVAGAGVGSGLGASICW
ncbi:hypothetical protein BH09GEM1_BH09GEM1_18250 [soil metagenome]